MNITFSYTGQDLIGPLEALLVRQLEEIASVDRDISALPAAVLEAATKLPMLTAKATPGEHEARALLSRRTDIRVGKRETELWLAECYRTPAACWQLGLNDLARLYSEQTTHEILASSRAQTPATVDHPRPPL